MTETFRYHFFVSFIRAYSDGMSPGSYTLNCNAYLSQEQHVHHIREQLKKQNAPHDGLIIIMGCIEMSEAQYDVWYQENNSV